MKKTIPVLFFCFLHFLVLGQSKGNAFIPGATADSASQWSSIKDTYTSQFNSNGNSSLGQSFVLENICGLNYVAAGVETTTRPSFQPGTGFPAIDTIKGLPVSACLNIIKAYLYYGVSYTEFVPPATTAIVTNPALTTNTYPATIIGTGVAKGWGEVGTAAYRADITGAIAGNGNYVINLNGFTDAAWEVDGLTIVIIYSEPASFSGSISLWDGQITKNGGRSNQTLTGFSVCAATNSASAFGCFGDMQNNVTPNTNSEIFNGSTVVFPNKFWNINTIPTTLTNSQSSTQFSSYTNHNSDGYSWILSGLYWQNTSCIACKVDSTSHFNVTLQSANPSNCSYNNGSITATASGGARPYTYLWSPGGGTDSVVNGLSAGTYTVFVADSNGCGVASRTITSPSVLSISTSSTSLTCHGSNNGTIAAIVSGGIAPYTYLWTGGRTTGTITGLSAGTYTLNVRDSLGCSATSSISLSQPAALSISMVSHTNPTCNGGTGSATADSAKGGTPFQTASIINTVAGIGGVGGFSGNGGAATAAEVNQSWGVTVDNSGNIYIADRANNLVRMVNTSGIITTFAGNGSNNSLGDGGPATAAGVQSPTGIALDGSGNVYITEWQVGYVVRKVNTSGIISTVAGNGSNVSSGDGGPATSAGINGPTGVAVDGTGNIFITDCNANKVRMVNTSGIINTVVNIPGTMGHSGDGGPATAAQLNAPFGLSLDGSNNLYIAEYGNNDIRKVNTSGIITTIAGTSLGFSGDGGPATAAKLYGSDGVVADGYGNIFIADTYNNRIRKVNSSGIISTYAGTGTQGETGDGGPAIAAELNNPSSVFVDVNGNVFTADWNGNKIHKISPAGSSYIYQWSPSGGTNLTASNLLAGIYTITATDANGCTATARASLSQPTELKITYRVTSNVSCNGLSDGSASSTIGAGTPPYTYSWTGGGTNSTVSGLSAGTYTLEVSDGVGSCAVSRVTITEPPVLNASTSIVSYVNCNGLSNGQTNVNAIGGTTTYKYLWSNGKTTDTIKNLTVGTFSVTVTDKHGCTATANAVITQPALLITKASVITNVSCNGLSNGSAFATTTGGTGYPYNIITIGGNGTADSIGDGTPAIYASINTPEGIAVDKSGNVYIADLGNNKVRKITKTGIITTIAGTGIGGYNGDGRPATSAFLSGPLSVAVDDTGNIFIADASNNRIRKVNTAGIITTVVGDGLGGSGGDGGPAISGELNNPGGVAVDDSGNIYIGDTGNNKIRKVNKSGILSTFAGTPGPGGFAGDGFPATSAQLNFPQGVAVDDSGNVFIADITNQRIRKVDKSGIINTFAGNGIFGYNGDNISATTAELNAPRRLAVDKVGNVYISDEFNNRVRKVNKSGIITTIAGNGVAGYNGDYINADSAELNNLIGVAVDDSGNVYIGDKLNERIRKVLPGYSYTWTPSGKNDPNVYNLSAQTYTVTTIDNHGCSASATVTITQPLVLGATTTHANVTCNGTNNGIATTSVNGGTMPYSYSWTNGGTNSSISGLSAGSYSLTITDNNGCSATQNATITEPPVLNANAFPTADVGCHGDSTGAASSTVSGGTLPYTYTWTGGNTNNAISSLSVGTYTLSIIDNYGCGATASATITQPANPLKVGIAAKKNVLCNGGTGWSTASPASGGTSPYIYYWAPSGGTNLHASGLSAGTYTIIAIDAHLCLTTDTVTITQPTLLIASASIISNINCFNNTSGAVGVVASGGTLPYTYAWSNSATTSTETGLSAGTYSVSVTDSNGCGATASLTITQPSALGVTANVTSTISCNGGSGAASSNANGGTTPYTYLWSNAQTTANVNGLSQGTYTITVTDSCGSQATASVVITQPNPLVISIASQNDVLCNNGTGNITANAATGGTSPYSYTWSPSGGTNLTASALSAGTYTITVKDANGCSSNASATLTQPTILTTTSATITNVSCNGGNNGSGATNPSGGTIPYTYSWSNSQTTSNAIGLTAGIYTVTITDFHGCSVVDSINVTQPPRLGVLAKVTKNVNCNDSASGSVQATASGGTPPYTYLWSSGGTNASQTGLTSASYTVSVTDNHGCSATSLAFVKQTTAFNIVRDSISDNGNCTGFAALTLSGGTQPYTFLWSPGNQNVDSIYGLCAGVYCCHISDSNNCQEYICMDIKTTVGISNIKNSSSIIVYPDPNNGYFFINGLIRGQVVELYDCLGQKVSSDIVDNETLQINISTRADAVYLLRVLSKNGNLVFQKKIVKTQ